MPKSSTSNNPKIAIFYDWLTTWGGAERLLVSILNTYPKSTLYTTVYAPEKTKWLPKNTSIKYIYQLPNFLQNKQAILAPIMPILLEKYNFDDYDILLSIGTIYPHCLLTKPKTEHLCYLLTPNRYLYNDNSKIPKFFRKIDSFYIHRPDKILAISKTVSNRIKEVYNITPKIVYPGVNTDFFYPKVNKKTNKKYFLCVSRLVPHKRVDLAIHACGQLNLPLVIVGAGRQFSDLKQQAEKYSNIKFAKQVDNQKLLNLYRNCTALISPQLEDFGLTNLEAQACGKPVIAFRTGGNSETIVHRKTGLLFDHQSISSLKQALMDFNSLVFSPVDCRNQSLKFSLTKFMLNLSNIIHESVKKSKTANQKNFL